MMVKRMPAKSISWVRVRVRVRIRVRLREQEVGEF